MPYFTHRVPTEEGLLEFSFERISTTNGIKYHVSAREANSVSYHFTMEPKEDTWKIVSAPLPPEWIFKLEGLLAEEIIKHLKNARTETHNI